MNTIIDVQNALESGKTTSKALVETYLKRIATYDESLNSLADLNHEALVIAETLDRERADKGPRSLLHGIPVVVKDNIFTHDRMRTTANSHALRNFYAPYDATLIQKLRDAGAIILAKANCSEFAYFMAMGKMPSGFGSMHGQVKHPYNTNIDPLGSSTGSAVAVAADLAVASIGTETNGSLMSPAQQNSVVSIKPTLGLVSRHGIIPITYTQDTAGPMTKNVIDAAIMLDVLKGQDEFDSMTALIPQQETNYLESCTHSIKGKTIGILSFSNYQNGDEEDAILNEAKDVLESHGATTKKIDFEYNMVSNLLTMAPEFKRDLNAFLATLKPYCDMTSLKDIIDHNKAHTRRNLKYGQSIFEMAQGSDERLKDKTYLNAKASLRDSINDFLSLYEDHNLDAIITTKISGYPPIGGLPSITVPAKPFTDEKPKSLLFIGKPFTEETLFSLAHTYEINTHKRTKPDLTIHKT